MKGNKMQYAIKGRIKILALAAAIILGSMVTYLAMRHKNSFALQKPYILYEFVGDERDVREVEQLFEQDLYWLTSRDYYNVREMMLKHSSDYDDPSKDGDLHIYIMRDKTTDAFMGFTAYHKLSFYKGKILFVGVAPAYRGKHLAGDLVQFDFEQLKKMGLKKAMLTARVDNKPARRAYEREGMKSYMEHDGFMYYEKDL